MKNFSNKKTALILALAIALSTLIGISAIASPGTDSDPLISLSYINDVLIPQIEEVIDKKFEQLSAKSNADAGLSFEIVNMKAGQKLIGNSGCEIILRQGVATIIATQKGGIADATAGVDLANGVGMPSNHLLIIPLDDGRGVNMQTDGILMVKGTYKVE